MLKPSPTLVPKLAANALTELGPAEQERKFVIDAPSAQAFWSIASSRLCHPVDEPDVTYVRTTYFDTPELDYFRSGEQAIARRLRVREYASPNRDGLLSTPDVCFLELKQSGGGRRAKTRLTLRPSDVSHQLDSVGDTPLTPCVASLYRRVALTAPETGLRVTLDDLLLFCRPRPIGSAFADVRPDEVIASQQALVLEIKLRGEPPAWLARLLGYLPEAVGFSKFMLGMRLSMEARRRAVLSTTHPPAA